MPGWGMAYSYLVRLSVLRAPGLGLFAALLFAGCGDTPIGDNADEGPQDEGAETGGMSETAGTGETGDGLQTERCGEFVAGQVTVNWAIEPPASGIVHEAVAAGAASFLISTTSGEVHLLDDSGALLRIDPPAVERQRVQLDPMGERFALETDHAIAVYGRDGVHEATTEASIAYLVPGRELTFTVDLEGSALGDAHFLNFAGEEVGRVDFRGVNLFALGSEHVVYLAGDHLLSAGVSGQSRWQIPFEGGAVRVATRGDRVLSTRAGTIEYFIDGRPVIVNYAVGATHSHLSPTGRMIAVSSQDALYTFGDGLPKAAIALPVQAVSSISVSDDGIVVVGGRDAANVGMVFVFTIQGDLLWCDELEPEESPSLPGVLAAGGGRALVWDRGAILGLDVKRGG